MNSTNGLLAAFVLAVAMMMIWHICRVRAKKAATETNLRKSLALFAALSAIPDEPVGEHLTREEMVAYVADQSQDPVRVETHLGSCDQCLESLSDIFDQMDAPKDGQTT